LELFFYGRLNMKKFIVEIEFDDQSEYAPDEMWMTKENLDRVNRGWSTLYPGMNFILETIKEI